MEVNANELVALAGIVKASQEREEEKSKKRKPKYDPAFPQFDRSLVTQFSEDPGKAGRRRAVGSGAVGAILGALAARMMSKDPKVVGAGALGGGALGGAAGFSSGRREAESDRSRLLFLRRLGVSRPGELEALLRHPEMVSKVTEEGAVI
jgi:hypothetical protein